MQKKFLHSTLMSVLLSTIICLVVCPSIVTRFSQVFLFGGFPARTFPPKRLLIEPSLICIGEKGFYPTSRVSFSCIVPLPENKSCVKFVPSNSLFCNQILGLRFLLTWFFRDGVFLTRSIGTLYIVICVEKCM